MFIVGEARSGTTLLFRLLQQQPAFGPQPPQLAESDFVVNFLTEPDLDARRCWKLRNYLMGDAEAWERFKRVAAPLLALRAATMRARPSLYGGRAGRLAGSAQLARVYLGLAAEVRGVTRLIDKSPFQVPYTGHLLGWFPGARVLYISRHPVDVLTSYWRRAEVEKASARWTSVDAATFADGYAARSAAALAWSERRPGAVRLVRYEDLVAEPRRVVGELCDFIGSAFDPEAVGPPDTKRPSVDPLTWEDVTVQTKDWRRYMDEDQALALESRLAGICAALGYARYTG